MTVLFVIATIVVFLVADWIVRRVRSRQALIARSPAIAPRPAIPSYPVRLPEGIFFSPSHTWLNLFPSGKVRLGVDDFITRLVREPEVVLVKHEGDRVAKGDPLILLKEGDRTLTVRSPIDGNVLTVNQKLSANPALLRDHLFSDGWGYVVKPDSMSEVKRMLIGSESRSWIRGEFQRLRDLLAGLGRNGAAQPAFLQDGGPPMAGIIHTMDEAVWQQLDREFLNVP